MLRQPMAGSEYQTALFGQRNAGGRTAELSAGALPYFNEDDAFAIVTIAADEINFATFDAKVALQNFHAALAQKLGSARFAGIADQLFRGAAAG
jgi:hypothetical protein